MQVRTLELARTGTFGRDGATITQRDLAEIKANFAGFPPLTLGHIPQGQTEAPRYGRVLSVDLAEKGNTLVGRVEFGDTADEAYSKGMYDGWSVSIPRRGKDGTRYLHSLALLGATPPKIPGLQALESVSVDYADGDKVETYSFGGTIKETEGMMTEQEISDLKKKNEELEAEKKKLLEEKAELEKAAEAAKRPAETAPPAAGGQPAAADGGKKEGDEFSDRLAKMEGELRKSRVEALMAKVGGKVPEGLRDKIRGLAGRVAGDEEPFNFSDNGKSADAKAVDLLGDILSQWPAPVKTGGSGGFDYSDSSGDGKAVDWGKVAKGM
jgi:hypothetical protein